MLLQLSRPMKTRKVYVQFQHLTQTFIDCMLFGDNVASTSSNWYITISCKNPPMIFAWIDFADHYRYLNLNTNYTLKI